MADLAGLVEGRPYIIEDRIALANFLAGVPRNLYIWNAFSWDDAYRPNERPRQVQQLRNEVAGALELWIGFKPGDRRYCMHASDRANLVRNAKAVLDAGANGIFLSMDDTHPGRIDDSDGPAHAALIGDLASKIGPAFKGICGEEYMGERLVHDDYWREILKVLPEDALITWTGPHAWNEKLDASMIPDLPRPVLLWDNYFVNDSGFEWLAPVGPYDGRSADLTEKVQAAVIHSNVVARWMLVPLITAMEFWRGNPLLYDAKEMHDKAIRCLSDMYWTLETGKSLHWHPLYDK